MIDGWRLGCRFWPKAELCRRAVDGQGGWGLSARKFLVSDEGFHLCSVEKYQSNFINCRYFIENFMQRLRNDDCSFIGRIAKGAGEIEGKARFFNSRLAASSMALR